VIWILLGKLCSHSSILPAAQVEAVPLTHRYRAIRYETIALGQYDFEVATRPALSETTGVNITEELLAAETVLAAGQRVLVAPSGRGALAAWAASRVGAEHVTAMDPNAIALESTRNTLETNGLIGSTVMAPASAAIGSFDVGLMSLPKGRALARLYLLLMALAIAPGGQLYVAGAKGAGIKSVLDDATALLGQGQLLSYRKGHRVARFSRPTLDFTNLPAPFDAPGLLPGTVAQHTIGWRQRELAVCSRPGVFSHGELDTGTAMLLGHLEVRDDDQVLDWGCGSGVIGLVVALQTRPEAITLLDVDAFACECAAATLEANGIVGVRVVHGDGLAALAGQRYSLIVSNPPFHSGHGVNLSLTEALIAESYEALAARGRLLLVANRFLPYDRLMRERFGSVDVLTQDRRFRVLQATK